MVSRVADTRPDIRLVAVLRDPLDRAVSKFRQELRAGNALPEEDLAAYLRRQVPGGAPWAGTDVVSVGEYGRILKTYLERVDRARVLVLFTQELDERPQEVFRQLFSFLEVDPDFVAPQPRLNLGGTSRRVSEDALDELLEELERSVFPTVDIDARRGFTWWLRHIWNIEPDDVAMDLAPPLLGGLAAHYLEDARLLEGLLDVPVPWRARLERAAGPA